MSVAFKLDQRQQAIVAEADKAAQQAHATGRYAPDELVRRMTSEAEGVLSIVGRPETLGSPGATLAKMKHLRSPGRS
jgi:hypothetical protein